MDEKMNLAKLSYGAGGLLIEGSESFVEEMVDRLEVAEWIHAQGNSFSNASKPSEEAAAEDGHAPQLPAPALASPLETFDHVYVVTDEGFSIIADVDENTIAKSARNYILLHLYGAYLTDRTEVGDDELRELCTNHACYDPGNFAQHVKGLGSKVHRIGSPRSYSLKLTAPGIRHARQFTEDTQKRAMSG
jgi:hypothetical protein